MTHDTQHVSEKAGQLASMLPTGLVTEKGAILILLYFYC